MLFCLLRVNQKAEGRWNIQLYTPEYAVDTVRTLHHIPPPPCVSVFFSDSMQAEAVSELGS